MAQAHGLSTAIPANEGASRRNASHAKPAQTVSTPPTNKGCVASALPAGTKRVNKTTSAMDPTQRT